MAFPARSRFRLKSEMLAGFRRRGARFARISHASRSLRLRPAYAVFAVDGISALRRAVSWRTQSEALHMSSRHHQESAPVIRQSIRNSTDFEPYSVQENAFRSAT